MSASLGKKSKIQLAKLIPIMATIVLTERLKNTEQNRSEKQPYPPKNMSLNDHAKRLKTEEHKNVRINFHNRK